MADRFKQSIVIDNKSGAGGTIGTAVAARAPADGYTLLLGDTGLTYAPEIYPKTGFDFGRDFVPISAVARVPYVLVVNPAKLRRRDAHRLHRGGEEGARQHRRRLGRPRYRHASRDRPVRGEDGHQAEPRALSRRRADAAGPARPGRSPPPSSRRAPSPRT